MEIQTLLLKITSSCGSKIYCAWSSIIDKGHRKSGVISIKHSRDNYN